MAFYKYLETRKNPLLVRHEVGKVKSTVNDLPASDWRYGKASSPDLAGVKELT